MKVSYILLDPTKNLTLLVASPAARSAQAGAAAELMRRFPEVEQVGFLEPSADPAARLHLQMMGGEFCGNAAMSCGAYLAAQDGLPAGRSADYPLTVSGMAGLLTCRIENTGEFCLGTVSMPLPEEMGNTAVPCAAGGATLCVPTVRFPGIVHCIVPAESVTRRQAEAAVRPLCAALYADACGILLWDAHRSFFSPLVYVSATDTAVWESGCASGSAAIGAWLAACSGCSLESSLRQPGGVIQACAELDGGHLAHLAIVGRVQEVRRGETEIFLR